MYAVRTYVFCISIRSCGRELTYLVVIYFVMPLPCKSNTVALSASLRSREAEGAGGPLSASRDAERGGAAAGAPAGQGQAAAG